MYKIDIFNNIIQKKFLIFFMVLFIFDRLIKYLLLRYFEQFNIKAIDVTSFFEIILVWNRGFSYGLFPQESYLGQIFICIFSLLICLWITKFIFSSKIKFKMVSLTLILAGALSNIIDRLLYSGVADFFHFYLNEYSWYVFNIADIYIVTGLMLLLLVFTWPNIYFKSSNK